MFSPFTKQQNKLCFTIFCDILLALSYLIIYGVFYAVIIGKQSFVIQVFLSLPCGFLFILWLIVVFTTIKGVKGEMDRLTEDNGVYGDDNTICIKICVSSTICAIWTMAIGTIISFLAYLTVFVQLETQYNDSNSVKEIWILWGYTLFLAVLMTAVIIKWVSKMKDYKESF